MMKGTCPQEHRAETEDNSSMNRKSVLLVHVEAGMKQNAFVLANMTYDMV